MITKINHIGIAVKSIDEAVKLYTDVLGLKVKAIEVLPDQKVRTAIIQVGESEIELIESTDPEGVIAKYIANKGEGLHPIAFEVKDVKAAIGDMVKKGVPMIDEKPRTGVEKTSIAFLHPKSTRVLLELVQPSGGK